MVETGKAQLGYGVTFYKWVTKQFTDEDPQRKGSIWLQSNSCFSGDKERIRTVHQQRSYKDELCINFGGKYFGGYLKIITRAYEMNSELLYTY